MLSRIKIYIEKYKPIFTYVIRKQKKKEVAQRGARTHDPGIKSPMLYRLS